MRKNGKKLCCIGFWDGGTAGTGGRVPGTAKAHPQIFQGTAGWGRKYIYIYIYIALTLANTEKARAI
jgi:hypothetical protein